MHRNKRKPGTNTSIYLADFGTSDDVLTEAFRMLRLHVDCLLEDTKNQSGGTAILITSAVQGEGKTTVACNLALACAGTGIDTLLIDADMRNPNVHKAFNLERSPGLSDVLLNHQNMPLQAVKTNYDNLWILTAGKSVHRSTELLGTPVLTDLMKQAANRYKLVILDSPPLGLVADAGLLATRVQGVYLVVRAGKTNRRTVEKTVGTLHKLGAEIKGIIMSRCNFRKNRYLYYADYPGYYSTYYKENIADNH
jgi:capsular exopolysaccharide synthesis family protein